MTDFYRFPAMDRLEDFITTSQLAKIKMEHDEAEDAYKILWHYTLYRPLDDKYIIVRKNYGMELMDIIHACETALRMEFTDKEIDELHESVIEKNTVRMYYNQE